MSSNKASYVVEMQPTVQRQLQMVPKSQANDHLWLTMSLIFFFFTCCFNVVGIISLVPGLICASVVSVCCCCCVVDVAASFVAMELG